jgi:hypothetical protein
MTAKPEWRQSHRISLLAGLQQGHSRKLRRGRTIVIPGRALRANPESINTNVAFSAKVASTVVMDSGPAPSKSAVADLDHNIAELG